MTELTQFTQTKHIDSYQKLRILIFFYEHADSNWTSPQIAARLYLGDGPMDRCATSELGLFGRR